MDNKDISKELWSLANIITGFSVVQSLGFAIAMGKDLAVLQGKPADVKIVLSICCVVYSVMYSVGVFRCYRLAMSVDTSHNSVWSQVTRGRIACIWIFAAVPIFGLFAPNLLGK